MKKQSGFTLIELLLVLAIIGVIAAIAAPTLLGQRARARDKAAMANATALVTDLVARYDQCRDLGVAVNNNATFTTNVLGTREAPHVRAFFTASNPWSREMGAYSEAIVQETQANGAATLAVATDATLGQVHIGFPPPLADAPGYVATAVYLRNIVNANANAGNAGHVFSTVTALD